MRFFFPEKEPEGLLKCEFPEGIESYSKCFRGATEKHLAVGEASTIYSKRPLYDGVAKIAANVLGPKTKIIYIVRDPIERMVSQYHHLHALGIETRGLNDALLNESSYSDLSRYAFQLEPWLDSFPEDSIFVIKFENYVADRKRTVAQICKFLNVSPAFDRAHFAEIKNATAGRYVATGVYRSVMNSNLYQYRLKPLMSDKLRDSVKRILLPKARNTKEELVSETSAIVKSRISDKDVNVWQEAY